MAAHGIAVAQSSYIVIFSPPGYRGAPAWATLATRLGYSGDHWALFYFLADYMESLDRLRREFTEKIRLATRLRSEALVRAFASVPREAFVGLGPWKLLKPPYSSGYELTPDEDPRHLYDSVVVALDDSRGLNNGEPTSLARWLDVLDLTPGKSVLHIGGGGRLLHGDYGGSGYRQRSWLVSQFPKIGGAWIGVVIAHK
jgi:hypothetical protein